MVPATLENSFMTVENRFEKIAFTLNFIRAHSEEKIILFLNTCASVDFYAKIFKSMLDFRKVLFTAVHG